MYTLEMLQNNFERLCEHFRSSFKAIQILTGIKETSVKESTITLIKLSLILK